MNNNEIALTRLFNQQIAAPEQTSASGVVKWFGAMQAQDSAMALWAIGLRMLNPNISRIEEAHNNGEIIRTHLMRPTWHYVSADDIYWLLELTAPGIKKGMKSRHKQLELSTSVVNKSKDIFIRHLSKEGALTRKELVGQLEQAGIYNRNNRASHLFMLAELDGLICSGPIKDNKQTYALLEERVRNKIQLSHEEALAELGKRYFTSHGPASLDDFSWWSGLTAKEARRALALCKPQLHFVTIDSKEYWFANNHSLPGYADEPVYLLPAFDEFIISYRNRSAVLTSEDHKKAIFRNGLFWPVIISNGKVAGRWKRTINKNKVLIETELFQSVSGYVTKLIEIQKNAFATFLGKEMIN